MGPFSIEASAESARDPEECVGLILECGCGRRQRARAGFDRRGAFQLVGRRRPARVPEPRRRRESQDESAVMELNLERVRRNVEQASTEDLLDRATVYRAAMEASIRS